MDKLISTLKLDVGYSKEPVVSDVNIEVSPGEILAIIGANGAGKSTILKTIVRQLKKLDGEIRICELDEASLSEEDMAKKISMVLTERIHPELMTCFDVVYGSEKLIDLRRSSVIVIPAIPTSALCESTALIILSNSISSILT